MILLCVYLVNPAQAVQKKLGQTGLTFLKVGVGARATGMAGAYTLVGDDASAIFYNPAGISKVSSSFDVMVSRTSWIADITYDAAALVKNLDTWGNVGVSLVTASYGDFMGTRVDLSGSEDYIETGTYSPNAYALGVTYARSLTNQFSVGGNVRYVKQSLGSNLFGDGSTVDNDVSGLAFDFGTIFYPGFRSLRFGMSVRNFSTEFKYQKYGFQLPLTFKIGIAIDAMDILAAGSDVHSLTVAFDATHPRDYTQRINLGAEYWFQEMVALRAGYGFNYDEEGLTVGAGFNYEISGAKAKIDFSYSEFGIFDSVNRITVGLAF